jgi:transcriptional regulator GlxA family with amidase domain
MFQESWEDLGRQSRYDVNQLAALCKVSLRTIQRHFALHQGQKPSQWLQTLRLQDAYWRIAAGESVKSVAFTLGFKQLSHFSRVFKHHFGFPPRSIAQPVAARLPRFEHERIFTRPAADDAQDDRSFAVRIAAE